MSPHRLRRLGTAPAALVLLASGCGGGTDQADAGATEPGASAGIAVSPSNTPAASARASSPASPTGKSTTTSAPASPSVSASRAAQPPRTLPTTSVPTGRRPDPDRPKTGQSFVVSLVERSGTHQGEVNLSEVRVDQAPTDPALADRTAVLLSYSALNTGTRTYRGQDPVGDRFFVRSDDQVMGEQHLYGPDDPGAPGACRTAGKVEWKRGSVLTGCAVLTLPRGAELGGIAFFDGDRKKPRLRVLRYP